jgi:tetraprenyl-beta-curcumene synthase
MRSDRGRAMRNRRVPPPLALGGALARALIVYWLAVLPRARSELRRWNRVAAEIPEPLLRKLALGKLRCEGLTVEGAAAFAVLTTRAHRTDVVRAVVAYEVLYDVVDAIGELPSPDPLAHNRAVHAALLDALAPRAPLRFQRDATRQDDGACYLTLLVRSCREAIGRLPSHGLTLPALGRFAARAAEAQSLNHAGIQRGDHAALASWARSQRVRDAFWWEVAAAAGDPLGVFALLAAAGTPGICRRDVEAIEHAYFPAIGALVWLMESLVDRRDDARSGNHSYVARYASPQEAARRLLTIALRARRAAASLRRGSSHAVLLAGVTSLYLSDPRVRLGDATEAADAIRDAIGWPVAPLLWVLRLRRKLP